MLEIYEKSKDMQRLCKNVSIYKCQCVSLSGLAHFSYMSWV